MIYRVYLFFPMEARTEVERAATRTRNTRERDILLKRAKDCRVQLSTEYPMA
ncbi:hypothetical protein [Granulicella sp. S190]|uniref:hypothetical protein n=1 Tax=Granulicella sp. S190 TaxID=1747226 RepID=UPI00131B1617|nr:hypothetical protein [Granulicella sp. S190]